MYDLPAWLHWISGIAEILGGLGLILPGLFRIQTRLIPLAAGGLALVMARRRHLSCDTWRIPEHSV